MLDFTKLAALSASLDDTFPVAITDLTVGEVVVATPEAPLTFTVQGADSAGARKAAVEARRAMYGNKSLTLDDAALAGFLAEQTDENNLRLATHCVTAWDGIVSGEEAVPCTEANRRAVFTALPPLAAIVAAEVRARSAFRVGGGA